MVIYKQDTIIPVPAPVKKSTTNFSCFIVGIIMVCIGWYKKSKSDKKVFQYIKEHD